MRPIICINMGGLNAFTFRFFIRWVGGGGLCRTNNMVLLVNHFLIRLQDVFGAIPGDTDYRMFANDYGDIPGLDMIFLLGGYYYHTSSDTVDRLLYASTGILVQSSRFVYSFIFIYTLCLNCTFISVN